MSEVEFGMDLVLNCTATNSPSLPVTLTFTWYRNGIVLVRNETRTQIETPSASGQIESSILTVRDVTFEDTADYTCQVYELSPNFDAGNTTTNVTVFGKSLPPCNDIDSTSYTNYPYFLLLVVQPTLP